MGDSFEPFDPDINEDEVDNYYQYCTAIPIGWSLAQSWRSLTWALTKYRLSS